MTKILIVDDEQKNLYLLQSLLNSSGFEVFSATNGAEALDLAYKTPPDVIISDILMPVMDGFSLCKIWKTDEDLNNIPFIFYTATYTDPKDESLALSLGADRFIIKPTEPDIFLKILNEVIEESTVKEIPAKQTSLEETSYYKEYNLVLVRKLEQKITQLEEKNRKVESDKIKILQAEKLLKENEELFRNAFDFAPIGKALIALNGSYLKVNYALVNLLGYSETELLKMKTQDTTHPDDLESQVELTKKLISGEIERFHIEKRCITKNQEIIHILLHMSLVRDENGSPNYLIAQGEDVTERIKAEAEIRHQISRAEALLKVSGSINSELDLDSVLFTICEETSKTTGVPAVSISKYEKENESLINMSSYGLPDIFQKEYSQVFLSDFPPEYSVINKTPIIINDIQKAQDLPQIKTLLDLGIRSIVLSRLENKGVVIGALILYSINSVRLFDFQDIDLIKGLSNQASQAIINSRLFEQTKWQLQNIQALHTIDKTIAGSMDIQMTLMVVAEKARDQLEVDAINILLYDPISNLLKHNISLGFYSENIRKQNIRIGEGIAGQIALNWKSVVIPDLNDYESRGIDNQFFAKEGFISYAGFPLQAKGRFLGILEVFNRKKINADMDWMNFLETLSGQAAIAIDNIKSYEDLQKTNQQLILAYDATIEGWSRAMDLRDKETEGHTQRVSQYAIRLARLVGISESQIINIRRGALLHDMGKLGIPDSILLKPDKLSNEEWDTMRKHPQFAFDMLYPIEYLRPVIDIPYCHHEKWDGSGYPRGLKREEIPQSARIFAVIDVWDALTTDRPYRKAWSREKAREYIEAQSGIHFDPQVVKIFLGHIKEIVDECL